MIRHSLILMLVVLFILGLSADDNYVRPLPVQAVGGIFVNSGQILGGETGNGVALGDLDGDGDTDAFVANDFDSFKGGSLHVWFNDGDGYFSSGPIFGVEDSYGVALGDLDGDGDLDALVVGPAPAQSGLNQGGTGSVQVWLNQGGAQGGSEGEFAAGVSFGVFASYGVALGDVDNDGDLDALVVGNSNQVWLNDGNAAFSAGPALPFLYSRAAVLADMDGDGWLDAVIADSQYGSNNRVYWNDGNWTPGPGSFTAGDPLPTASLMRGTAVADLDGDNQPDIFLAGSGQEQIFWNEGLRNFSTAGPLPLNDLSNAVALADVDGDADLDAVIANGGSDNFNNQVWRNDGGRLFTADQSFISPAWNRGLGLADLNSDGSPDVFVATTGEDQVWFNTSIPPVIPNEEGWQIQTVDERGDTGFGASLALDADGYPHIAYGLRVAAGYSSDGYYIWQYTLRYTYWDGVRWHNEVIRSGLAGLDDFSLALDGNGYPHIAYVTEYLAPPRYTHWDGAQWQDAPILLGESDDGIENIELALDNSDNRHFSYEQDGRLKYAFWDGASWLVEEIDTADGPGALALDAAGNPHLSYVLGTFLKYAHKEGGTWQIEYADADSFILSRYSALALDGEGRPHIGYYEDSLGFEKRIKYAYWDGNSWQIQIVHLLPSGHTFETLDLNLDSSGNPHFFFSTVDLIFNPGTYYQYAHWDGASWQVETLDYSGYEGLVYPALGIVLDGADRVHASYYEPQYKDLRYLTWAANWQIRALPETGTSQRPAIDVEATIPHIGYYSLSGGQVKLASWEDAWELTPLDFVANPVTDLSIEVGAAAHVSYYDADNQRLLYAYQDFLGVWHFEVVDEAGDVGRFNELVLANPAGGGRIAYWDATSLRIKLAISNPDILLWDIYPNLAGPPLNANSGSLSTAVLPGGDIGVSYYDGVNGDLRLAVWDSETAAWTDELVDGATADVGRLNSLQTDGTEGVPVVAYLGQGTIRYAYKAGGLWQIQDVPGTTQEPVTSLSLELGLNSRQQARIAYFTEGGALNVAHLRDGIWETEYVESGAPAIGEVAATRDSRLHLAYTRSGNLRYAFRTATLVASFADPLQPPEFYQDPGDYNPLDACQAIFDPLFGNTAQNFDPFTADVVAQQPTAPLSDLAIFGAMSSLFSATPGGHSYIELYRQHGSEMGQIGLEDPQLLWDAFGTLQNFLPGLEALVTGRGDEQVVTQKMVDDALDIWQRLAAVGSPELATVIHDELAQYNNLQDFVGLTFDEWALAIGVNPPPETVYLPVILKE
jgi:hypothetical protein